MPQMIYFNIYERNISWCLEQNLHYIQVNFLHVCVFSACMSVLYVHLVRVRMHVITFHVVFFFFCHIQAVGSFTLGGGGGGWAAKQRS